jgi:hypothetical protein
VPLRRYFYAANAGYEVEFRGTIARTVPSLSKALEDNEERVRWKATKLIGKLANNGKWKLDGMGGTADAGREVEFRAAIASTMPSLIKSLEDNAENIRLETIKLIGNFANHRECQLNWYCQTINLDHTVEFREAVITTIPSLVKPLQDKAKTVRQETVKLIGNLANRGEW